VALDSSGSADDASKLILAIFILSGAASRHGGLQRIVNGQFRADRSGQQTNSPDSSAFFPLAFHPPDLARCLLRFCHIPLGHRDQSNPKKKQGGCEWAR